PDLPGLEPGPEALKNALDVSDIEAIAGEGLRPPSGRVRVRLHRQEVAGVVETGQEQLVAAGSGQKLLSPRRPAGPPTVEGVPGDRVKPFALEGLFDEGIQIIRGRP